MQECSTLLLNGACDRCGGLRMREQGRDSNPRSAECEIGCTTPPHCPLPVQFITAGRIHSHFGVVEQATDTHSAAMYYWTYIYVCLRRQQGLRSQVYIYILRGRANTDTSPKLGEIRSMSSTPGGIEQLQWQLTNVGEVGQSTTD